MPPSEAISQYDELGETGDGDEGGPGSPGSPADGDVFGYGDTANLGLPSSTNLIGFDAATAIFATSDAAGYGVSSVAMLFSA
jgi:hypothetical protein